MTGKDSLAPVGIGDLLCAARACLAVPAPARVWTVLRMLREAEMAAEALDRTGHPHPRYGDGSVMASALRRSPPPATDLCHGEWRSCLRAVLDGIDIRENLRDRVP